MGRPFARASPFPRGLQLDRIEGETQVRAWADGACDPVRCVVPTAYTSPIGRRSTDAALGEPADPTRHGAILDEALTVIDALWSGEAVNHRGVYFKIDGVRFRPRPIQRPRIPIWCAASLPSRAGVRRGARWDGVAPMYSTPGEKAAGDAGGRRLSRHRSARRRPSRIRTWWSGPSRQARSFGSPMRRPARPG